jgi:hypothetical protein
MAGVNVYRMEHIVSAQGQGTHNPMQKSKALRHIGLGHVTEIFKE